MIGISTNQNRSRVSGIRLFDCFLNSAKINCFTNDGSSTQYLAGTQVSHTHVNMYTHVTDMYIHVTLVYKCTHVCTDMYTHLLTCTNMYVQFSTHIYPRVHTCKRFHQNLPFQRVVTFLEMTGFDFTVQPMFLDVEILLKK